MQSKLLGLVAALASTGVILPAYASVLGFLDTGGTYTTINGPVSNFPHTPLSGINDAGQIVGFTDYDSNSHGYNGFLYSGGTYTTVKDPSATFTFPYGINNAGQIAGFRVVSGTSSGNGSIDGFLYSGGVYTTFDVPFTTNNIPMARAINNLGSNFSTYDENTT